jgi:hypothetical protein
MTTDTTLRVFTQPLPPVLARLRAAMIAAGDSATSPDDLGPEGERMAREDRKDH